MSGGLWTMVFLILAVAVFLVTPQLDYRVMKKALGMAFFLELFYLIGHYMTGWPFPGPLAIIQILAVVGLGTALGGVFSKYWPLPEKMGIERVIRTFILGAPALLLGIGLQLLMQGNQPTQALFLIFALTAWLGSGKYRRLPEREEGMTGVEVKGKP